MELHLRGSRPLKIVFCLRSQLRACATTGAETLTISGVVAPAREGIHVVQGPDDRYAARKPSEEGPVIEKIDAPMKVQYIAGRQLVEDVGIVLAAVVAKES